jgi:hypothetical protein
MENDLRDYQELMDLEKSILFKFFGGEIDKEYEEEKFAAYSSDEFVVSVRRSWDGILVSCDLSICYNKESQNPINFYINVNKKLSKRKEHRIFAALNFIRANKKEAGQFWSCLPSFDDLGQHVRREFLKKEY